MSLPAVSLGVFHKQYPTSHMCSSSQGHKGWGLLPQRGRGGGRVAEEVPMKCLRAPQVAQFSAQAPSSFLPGRNSCVYLIGIISLYLTALTQVNIELKICVPDILVQELS